MGQAASGESSLVETEHQHPDSVRPARPVGIQGVEKIPRPAWQRKSRSLHRSWLPSAALSSVVTSRLNSVAIGRRAVSGSNTSVRGCPPSAIDRRPPGSHLGMPSGRPARSSLRRLTATIGRSKVRGLTCPADIPRRPRANSATAAVDPRRARPPAIPVLQTGGIRSVRFPPVCGGG